jgi:gliding motility-associated-like protein
MLRMMDRIYKKLIFGLIIILFSPYSKLAMGQYIGLIQTEPFSTVTSVCAGGEVVFRVNNLENLSNGSIINIELSNQMGSFASGTTILTTISWSLNLNGPFTNGNYVWNGTVGTIYIRVLIPNTLLVSNGYNFRARSSNPLVYSTSVTGSLNVTAPITTIATINSADYGIGKWNGHVFSWTPPSGNTPLTQVQANTYDFFNQTNYKGHVVKNNLNFDDNFMLSGFLGSNNFYNESSIGCGSNMRTNFSIRYKRKENFVAGLYNITIGADDGVRLSIDGGATWILNKFQETTYQSVSTTNSVCLSGNTDLVLEYYQRPADARVSVNFSLASNLIVTNPVDVTVCAGEDANFTVVSNGANSYQWQIWNSIALVWQDLVNGVEYSNVNSNILTVNNVTIGMNDYLYRCEINSSCGSAIYSDDVLLNVTENSILFNEQPDSINVCIGGNSVMNVDVGNGVNTYVWQVSSDGGVTFNTINSNGINYSNISSSSLNIQNIPIGFDGNLYSCIVTNSCGVSSTSNVGLLEIEDFMFLTMPNDLVLCAGQSGSFTISGNFNIGNSYVWELSIDGGNTYSTINNNSIYNGATTANLNLTNIITGMNNYKYRCVVTSSCSGITYTSSAGTLTISSSNILILSQPSPLNLAVCTGGVANWSIVLNNTANVEWQMSNDGGTTFTTVNNNSIYSGSTSLNFAVNVGSTMNGWKFRCKINDCNSVFYSNVVTIDLIAESVFSLQPMGLSNLCISDTVNLNCNVSNAQSYQWYVINGTGSNVLVNSVQYNGVGSSSLTINGISISGLFFCKVTGNCSSTLYSDTVLMDVISAPLIVTQPNNANLCLGDIAELNVQTSGDALIYKWYRSTDGLTYNAVLDTGNFNGSLLNNLTVGNLGAADNNTSFFCVVSNTCNSIVYSDTVGLIINTSLPNIVTQPIGSSHCIGDVFSIDVVSEVGVEYQWQLDIGNGFVSLQNDFNYNGVLTQSLQINSINIDSSLLRFRCIITNCVGDSISEVAEIVLLKRVKILNDTGGKITVCSNDSINKTIIAEGDDLNYSWQLTNANGVYENIASSDLYFEGFNTNTLTIIGNVAINGKKLRCIVNGSCLPESKSKEYILTLSNSVEIVTNLIDEVVCEGKSVFPSVIVNNDNYEIEWYEINKDGTTTLLEEENEFYDSVKTNFLKILTPKIELSGTKYFGKITGDCGEVLFTDTMLMEIKPRQLLNFVPTAFSPNGDGLNDSINFDLEDLETLKGSIYNRWGSLIFNIDKNNFIWDGKINSNTLPTGVYPYILFGEKGCGYVDKKGFITIIE